MDILIGVVINLDSTVTSDTILGWLITKFSVDATHPGFKFSITVPWMGTLVL